MIVFSLLLIMGTCRIFLGPIVLTLSHLFVGCCLLYYGSLDLALAILTGLALRPLLRFAERVAELPIGLVLPLFLVTFVGGWIIQFLGHWFEGRRPALFESWTQIFVAPLFLVVEALGWLGFYSELRREVEELSRDLD